MSRSSLEIDAFCPVGIGGTKGIDTSKLKLFIGGLKSYHSSKDLYDIFVKYGTIRESVVIPDRFRVRSRCYGFVTFANEKSVRKVIQNKPIITKKDIKLTVVLASANTKPRRAHFNVKHGISGHKPLPTVHEKQEISAHNSKPNKPNKYSIKQGSNRERIGIYTDPSLFRTANIQQIAPAQFEIKDKKKNNEIQKENVFKKPAMNAWPNDDIKKDFKNLGKVTAVKEKEFINNKSWKLMSVEKEPSKLSYHSSQSNLENLSKSDDFYNTKSREWTPIHKTENESVRSETTAVTNGETELDCDNYSEDRLTFKSDIFEGLFDNNERIEMDQLRNMFKDRMQTKILHKNSNNKHFDGTWSPYRPNQFGGTHSTGQEYNFQNMAPTPPIQPVVLSNNMNINNVNQSNVNLLSNENNTVPNNVYFANNQSGYGYDMTYMNAQNGLFCNYNYNNGYFYNTNAHSMSNGK